MKRIFKSPEVPEGLRRYASQFPNETWEHFRRANRRGYREIKQQLLKDQHGLCAYCEINIKFADEEGEVDDFRVEHFYPKSETDFAVHNYHLDWQNLLGVCHGGSQPNVEDAEERFSKRKIDRSCDVPKAGKPINERILNPLLIPAKARIYRYAAHSGRMIVDEDTCPPELVRKARNTIRELNLNAPRLMRMRRETIMALQDEIEAALDAGADMEEVLNMLAQSFLVPDDNGNCQAFFSLIRWFLGDAAEQVLSEYGYTI